MTHKISNELRAVLHVVNAEKELLKKALPFIDIERENIDWKKIWQNDFGGGHSAALVFAQAIWCDCVQTKADPFDRAFSMSQKLQAACLQALAIRWGLLTEAIT